MTWPINKLYFLLFLLNLGLPQLKSCGIHYRGDEYRVALLNPYIIGPDYSAFFYASERQFHYQAANFGADRQRNCKEWVAAVDGLASFTDVYAFLYGASYDDILALQKGINTKYADNAFVNALIQPAYKDLLTYVIWAKSYEAYSIGTINDPWSYDSWGPNHYDEARIAALHEQAEATYQYTTDSFLKERYAYQLIVLARHAHERDRINELYEKHFASNSESILASWAKFHHCYFIKDSVEQAYQYALLFQQAPEKAVYAKQHFDLKLLPQVLEKAKSKHERAVILILAEIHNPGRSLDKIKEIYQLDPQQKLLSLLLVREINKLEDWLLTPALTGNEPAVYPFSEQNKEEDSYPEWGVFRKKNRAKDEIYLSEVLDFVKRESVSRKSSIPRAQVQLMLSHLYSLTQNTAAAQQILSTVAPQLDEVMQEQLLTEKLLLLVQDKNIDLGNKNIQDEIADLLYRLAGLLPQRTNGRRDLDALHLLLAKAYQTASDPSIPYLFNNHAWFFPTAANWSYGSPYYQFIRQLDWQASLADVDAILAFLNKENRSRFEQYLAAAPLPDRNALLDLRGTIALRNNQLDEALASFSQVDQDFWQECYEFSAYLQDDPFSYPPLVDSTAAFPATKTAYVKKLITLEAAANKGDEEAMLLLGVAWLNSTFYGNSWMMYTYGQSTMESSRYRNGSHSSPNSKYHHDNYYRGDRAAAYLKRAMESSSTQEISAKASFLLTRINEYRTIQDFYADDYYRRDDSTLVQLIRENYQNWGPAFATTQTYHEIVGACPRLQLYWGKPE